MPLKKNEDFSRFGKPVCQLGYKCPILARFTENNDYSEDDMKHCHAEVHAGRRGGMSIKENFNSTKFLTAYQHYTKARAHQRELNFWGGIVHDGDLRKEVIRNGCQHVLTGRCEEKVTAMLSNPRHVEMGSPLS